MFKNFFYLGFNQVLGLLIPVLLAPYLIRIIGISGYGIVVTCQAFALFFNTLNDFGFNVTAVRDIALSKGDKSAIKTIISNVFAIKLLLIVLSIILFVLVIFSVFHFRQNFFLHLMSFTMIVGQAFLPLWYYQGMEQIGKTILPIAIGKLVPVVAILLLVKDENDAILINLFIGLGSILSAIMLVFPIIKRYDIGVFKIDVSAISQKIKENLPFLFSNLGVQIYSNSATLLLSFFVTAEIVGVFNVAERIIQLGKAMLVMAHQVTYPRLCSLITKSHSAALLFITKTYKFIWTIVAAICVFIFIFSSNLASYFIKDIIQNGAAVNMLKALSAILFIIALNMPFYQTLLVFKKDWHAANIIFFSAIISLILIVFLTPKFGVNGLIMSLYTTESLVTISLIYAVRKFKKELYAI